MNIFYLDTNPVKAARAMTNVHVVKMILESAQLLCTAHRVLDGKETTRIKEADKKLKYWEMEDENLENTLYKPTHYNHPSAIWVRESKSNYMWLFRHFAALCTEFFIRHDHKIHPSWSRLSEYLMHAPKNIPDIGPTEVRLAIPEVYRFANPVDSYRAYYVSEKLILEEDKNRYHKVLKI